LEGTAEDWQKMMEDVVNFSPLDTRLDTWGVALLSTLEKFADAASGKIDRDWWNSFYKENNMSGGPYIKGHINTLFPFIEDRGNLTWRSDLNSTMTTDRYPASLSQAPVDWDYLGTNHEMEFVAGLMGFQSLDTVKPAFGWAVVEK
jgi:hypothetical protein